jgi:hypothetical protein
VQTTERYLGCTQRTSSAVIADHSDKPIQTFHKPGCLLASQC